MSISLADLDGLTVVWSVLLAGWVVFALGVCAEQILLNGRAPRRRRVQRGDGAAGRSVATIPPDGWDGLIPRPRATPDGRLPQVLSPADTDRTANLYE